MYQKSSDLRKHLIISIYIDFLRLYFPFFCIHWLMGYNKASLVVRTAPSGLRLLFILPSVRLMSATLQLTAVRPSVFFHGTTTAQVVVQVIVRPIVDGLVGEVPTCGVQFCRRLSPRLVVVEVSIDPFVRRDERNDFDKVRYRVQHDDIVRRGRVAFERQKREVVHESLENEARRIIAAAGRRGFRGAALEIAVAQLPASVIIAEPDGEIGFVRHTIMYLRTMHTSCIKVDVPLSEVSEQGRAFQRPHLFDDN